MYFLEMGCTDTVPFPQRTKHPVLTRPISCLWNPFSAPKLWSPGYSGPRSSSRLRTGSYTAPPCRPSAPARTRPPAPCPPARSPRALGAEAGTCPRPSATTRPALRLRERNSITTCSSRRLDGAIQKGTRVLISLCLGGYQVPARTLAKPIARSVLEYPFVLRLQIEGVPDLPRALPVASLPAAGPKL